MQIKDVVTERSRTETRKDLKLTWRRLKIEYVKRNMETQTGHFNSQILAIF